MGKDCVSVEEIENLSERVYPDVRDFAQHYRRKEYAEAKKSRLRIERTLGKGAMPAYPTHDELACPRALAKKASCASNMIRSGRAKGYQANAVCRASVNDCSVCRTLPKCRR
jgi:hypothetical protein